MPAAIREEDVIRSLCKPSLYEFLRVFWPVVIQEPLVDNWHIRAVCAEVQAVAERVMRGEDKEYDLVINISPGTSKSTIVSVMLPAWVLANKPSARMICASYTATLAQDLSVKCRDVVKSDLYQAAFPEVRMRDDQDTKMHFKTTAGGERFAVGVDGSVLGKHADLIIIDDPLDPNEAASAADLQKANRWLKDTLSTRKTNKTVTATVLVMQRLHQDDPTQSFLDRGGVRHVCLPAELADNVKPSFYRRFYRDGLMDPKRLNRKALEDAKGNGELFYCTPGFTPILMADWTEKSIEDVTVGDEVVGFITGANNPTPEHGGRRSRSRLVPSTVVAKTESYREVVRVRLESGREIYCTADHKWWTRRYSSEKRHEYAPAKVGRKLWPVYDLFDRPTAAEQRDWDWLGGFIDGEGACRHGNISISQSWSKHKGLCLTLEKVLDRLKLSYTKEVRPAWKSRGTMAVYVLSGGRSMKIRMINCCRLWKRRELVASLWRSSGYVCRFVRSRNGLGGRKNRVGGGDRVVSVEPVGRMVVYGLTTTTGNYVAWGYASRNCGQYGQNPAPAAGAMFAVDRIEVMPPPNPLPPQWREVRAWDKAASTGRQAAYTVGVKVGFDGRKLFVLDVVRDRLDYYARERLIQQTAEADGPDCLIVLEQEGAGGGKESAQATVAELVGYQVEVLTVGGGGHSAEGDKVKRAIPASVQVGAGNVRLCPSGAGPKGWHKAFLEELRLFPFARFKDQVDAFAHAVNVIRKAPVRCGAVRA